MVRSATALAVIALSAVPSAAAFAPGAPVAMPLRGDARTAAVCGPMMMATPAGRREALGVLAAGILGVTATPPSASAADGWGAAFRKQITGEVEGEERALIREKKQAVEEGGDGCTGAYQCFEVNNDTEGGKFARLTVEGVSFLAPAKWTKAEASGEVAASWSDGKGGVVALTVRPAEGITIRDTTPTGAMSDSVNKLQVAQVGSKIAKERGYSNTGGKARKIKGENVVVFSLGMKGDKVIEAMDVAIQGPSAFILSCTAPLEAFDIYKQDFGAILQSVSFKPAA